MQLRAALDSSFRSSFELQFYIDLQAAIIFDRINSVDL